MTQEQAVDAAHESVRALSLALKAHILSSSHTLVALGPAIGHAAGYLTATFAGQVPLKMREVFALFEAMDEPPRPFFKRLYPLAERPREEAEEPVLRLPSGETFTFRDVIERGLANLPVPPADELVARAGRILRARIKAGKRTQLDLSRILIDKPTALGQALRGGSGLEAFHVFGVLHLLDLPPAPFFAELLWPDQPGIETGDMVGAMAHLLKALR